MWGQWDLVDAEERARRREWAIRAVGEEIERWWREVARSTAKMFFSRRRRLSIFERLGLSFEVESYYFSPLTILRVWLGAALEEKTNFFFSSNRFRGSARDALTRQFHQDHKS